MRAEGSAFQREVWAKISEIPYGETRTYAEIAESLGKPGALQAVGQACGRNPIRCLSPAIEWLGSNGKLGGYAFGPTVKKFLLDLEAKNK